MGRSRIEAREVGGTEFTGTNYFAFGFEMKWYHCDVMSGRSWVCGK
jgi:hypothetical protein